jgi:hypothetical protein
LNGGERVKTLKKDWPWCKEEITFRNFDERAFTFQCQLKLNHRGRHRRIDSVNDIIKEKFYKIEWETKFDWPKHDPSKCKFRKRN